VHRAVFALLFLPAIALAQITVGDEVVSDPVRPHNAALTFAAPAVSLAKDGLGVAITWSMPNAQGIERVYVARLDDTGQVSGAVREISSAFPQADIVASSIAANPTGLGFTVAWLENTEVVYRQLDAALTPSAAPVPLAPSRVAPLVRSGPKSKSLWIAADSLLYGIAPDGTRDVVGIPTSSDMTVATDFPRVIGSQLMKTVVGCTCFGGGPFKFCIPGCEIFTGHYTIDFRSIYGAALTLYTDRHTREYAILTDAQPAIAGDANSVTAAWLEGDEALGGKVMALRVPLSSLDSFSSAPALTLGTFGADAGPTRPAVASDGERAIVVWRTQTSPGNHDVAGAVIDADGKITPLTIAASSADERDPSVIAIGHGAFLVAYDKVARGERRIAGRFVTFARQRAVR
jgi:hypothetical protein